MSFEENKAVLCEKGKQRGGAGVRTLGFFKGVDANSGDHKTIFFIRK